MRRLTVYPHTCERCHQPFHSARKETKFCGLKCRDKRNEKVDPEKLKALAATGMERKDIAAAVGINEGNVLIALRRHGLYQQWQEQRWT